ncbi:discoidin domain-containing protein [Streptomyces sp. NPDC054813]
MASDLAGHALTLALSEIRRGVQPPGPWRHRLLMLVQQLAVTWASDSRRDRLAPGFLACLAAMGAPDSRRRLPVGARPQDGTMLDAFHSLPERTQILLWHAVLEAEPDAAAASLLSTETDAIGVLKLSAQQAMHGTYLRTHLRRNGDQTCARFQRLIEATANPGGLRRSLDLEQHMDTCACCTVAVSQLFHLIQDPRGALAEGLLGWGSSGYLADAPHTERIQVPVLRSRPTDRADHLFPAPSGPRAGQTPTPGRHRGRHPRRTTAVAAMTVVAVAVVAAVTAAALMSDGRVAHHPASPTTRPPLTLPASPFSPPAATRTSPPAHAGAAGDSSSTKSARPRPSSPSPTPAAHADDDVNLALHRSATAGSFTQTYAPSNAVDADTTSYWESADNALPQWFEVDLGHPADVRRLVMHLPPLADWNTRRQTIAVEAGTDGHHWYTVVSPASYTFAAPTGNSVTAVLPAHTRARYLKLTFTSNTGWPAAQLSELEVFRS